MSKTYFISGHRDITEEEFIQHYEPILWEKINEPDVKFILSDCRGVDEMSQKYLKAMGMTKNEVTIYHMFEEPRCNVGFGLVGGFNNPNDVDCAMTENSDADILWIKLGKENSSTAKNLQRRKDFL